MSRVVAPRSGRVTPAWRRPSHTTAHAPWPPHAQQLALPPPLLQHITKYTEREIINHMKLRHPHVIALREVRLCAGPNLHACRCPP